MTMVRGYAAIWEVYSFPVNFRYFRYNPYCFTQVLEAGKVIYLQWEHEAKYLGSTDVGDFKIGQDEIGLRFEWWPKAGSLWAVDKIRSKPGVYGASIGWDPSRNFLDEQVVIDKMWRYVHTIFQCKDLLEISITETPRFPQTRQFLQVVGR